MKTENYEGITETKKNVIIDLDEYCNRERYYTGSNAGKKLIMPKEVFAALKEEWNNAYDNELDVLIGRYRDCGKWPETIREYRRGRIVD